MNALYATAPAACSIYDMLSTWGIINHRPAGGPGALQQQQGALASQAGRGAGSMPPGTACLFDFKVRPDQPALLLQCLLMTSAPLQTALLLKL
jgi:hypothetical protein